MKGMKRKVSRHGPASDYSYTVEGGVICIVDHNNGRSVTNDAEAVIEDLVRDGLAVDSMPVIYRDTRGVWDEMVIADGRFSEFRIINKRDKEAAKAEAKR